MPRGRCHFSLLLALQNRLLADLPDVAELAEAHFADFLAGSLAPDAMRSLGRLGKLRSHFYTEAQRETWGKSVSGMFLAHPDLSNPDQLSPQDLAFLLGYIAHLTTDEAFRDEVTIHVHGVSEWRPIIRGLWSLVDEFPIVHPDLGGQIDIFKRSDRMGFIDCEIAGLFLRRARGWAVESDPWLHEQVFLKMIGKEIPEEFAKETFTKNRALAMPYLSDRKRDRFVGDAVQRGFDEISKFMDGAYAKVV